MTIEKSELQHFVSKGIITHDQMEKMLKESSVSSKTNFGNVIGKVILIGSILFGFGIITWIATNWDLIPDSLKIIGTLLVIFASFWTASFLREKSYEKVSEGVFLVGGLAVGGLYALISQIYNLDSGNYSGILFIWFISILLPTYIFNARMLSIMTSVLFSTTASSFIIERLGNQYDFKYLSLVLLSQMIIFLIGGLHYKYKEYVDIGRLYRLAALSVGTISFLFITFSGDWYYNYSATEKVLSLQETIYLFLPLLAIVILSVVTYLGNYFKQNYFHLANVLLVATGLFLTLNMLSTDTQQYTIFVYLNILFVLSILGIVYISVMEKDKNLLNFGVIAACLYIFSKAINWITMLDGYVFFMSIGLILILVGYVSEKIRKELLEKINNKN